jgi:hypothetical protein
MDEQDTKPAEATQTLKPEGRGARRPDNHGRHAQEAPPCRRESRVVLDDGADDLEGSDHKRWRWI